MRRLLPVLLGATLLVAGCGDDGDDDRERAAATSVPDDTTSSTTTTEPPVPPPDVIPSDPSLITEEYVEQVLDELQGVDLAALLAARTHGLVNEQSLALLQATTSEAELPQRVNDLSDLASTGFEGLVTEPRAMSFDVIEILAATDTCIVAEVRGDSTGLYPDSTLPDGAREFIRLFAATQEQLASGLNPTAWSLDQLPVTLDGAGSPVGCP